MDRKHEAWKCEHLLHEIDELPTGNPEKDCALKKDVLAPQKCPYSKILTCGGKEVHVCGYSFDYGKKLT